MFSTAAIEIPCQPQIRAGVCGSAVIRICTNTVQKLLPTGMTLSWDFSLSFSFSFALPFDFHFRLYFYCHLIFTVVLVFMPVIGSRWPSIVRVSDSRVGLVQDCSFVELQLPVYRTPQKVNPFMPFSSQSRCNLIRMKRLA